MVYREQAYRESAPRALASIGRCACNAPSTGPCDSCGRPWCETHRKGALCYRCADVIGRELAQRGAQRMVAAVAAELAVTFGMLAMHTLTGLLIGVPFAIGAYVATPRLQRRRLIARMGPRLAATTGEILPPRPAEDHWTNSSTMPVSGMENHH